MLLCSAVSKRYGTRQVLTDCNLSVRPGSCTLIRGPSGGGKSTLMKVLALLEPADTGVVKHDDVAYTFPLAREFPVPVYPYLTMVFQQLYLWPNLTIRENIAVVLEGDRAASLDARAIDLLKRFAVQEELDLRPHECSLGQRQRVAIARALLTPAKYLLLDEPTSALDRVNRATVIATLEEAKTDGRGLLIVSHDLGGVDEIANEIHVLEDSRLTAGS